MSEAWRDRIVCDLSLHHGEPCVRGTRVPVAVVVSSMADMSVTDLLKEYPQLTQDDIQACLRYAAEASSNTLVA